MEPNPRTEAPVVSVVIPAYGAEDFITETVGSIRRQSYRPVEVVIVEDCSPDRTADVVEGLIREWSEPGLEIRLLRQPVNGGGAAALSRGFSEAKGDYLCWLSADDAFVGTTKLGEQVAQLKARPGISYSRSFHRGSDLKRIGEDTLIVTSWDPARTYMDRVMRLLRARLIGLLFRNPINGSTVMIDRFSWSRLGDFDSSLGNIDQDSDMWMRYSALGARISLIEGPAGFYRIHPGQTSNRREECIIGGTATRMRIIMAYERTGRLPKLLSTTLPVLALALRWQWYLDRPLVAAYLAESGLRVSRNPFVRSVLSRLQMALDARCLIDERLLRVAEQHAETLYGSYEFRAFVERIESEGHFL